MSYLNLASLKQVLDCKCYQADMFIVCILTVTVVGLYAQVFNWNIRAALQVLLLGSPEGFMACDLLSSPDVQLKKRCYGHVQCSVLCLLNTLELFTPATLRGCVTTLVANCLALLLRSNCFCSLHHSAVMRRHCLLMRPSRVASVNAFGVPSKMGWDVMVFMNVKWGIHIMLVSEQCDRYHCWRTTWWLI